MSYYLYIKSRCAGQHAGLSGDFSVEYRTSLPISNESVRAFASHVTALHTESGSAETVFEIHNGNDRFQMLYGMLISDDGDAIGFYGGITYLRIHVNPNVIYEATFKAASRCIKAANAVTSGFIPSIDLSDLEKEA